MVPSVACFGRLIGSEKHRGKGYGKLLVELKSLVFEYEKYEIIIAGNNEGDLVCKF